MRIGIGFDVHAFEAEGLLILGGVRVPYPMGLKGHSDADVLTHAVCDAVLGAAALGDIGLHFPDNDQSFADMDSLILLRRCTDMAKSAGFSVVNVDVVVIAQEPNISPYRDKMAQHLAQAMGIEASLVNIKATTTEKLGFVGRKEGIAAQAVCMLKEG